MAKEVSLESVGLDFTTTEIHEENPAAVQQIEQNIEEDLSEKEETVTKTRSPSPLPKGSRDASSNLINGTLKKTGSKKEDSVSTLG